jgi:phosphoribosylanthranilate isomerase
VRIKICGITSITDALLAARWGADAIGLNFFPESPRYVSPHVAEEIVEELPPLVEPVAVLVHPSAEQIRWCRGRLHLRSLQCHALDLDTLPPAGQEPGLKLIVAWGIAESSDLETVRAFVRSAWDAGWRPTAILADARVPGQHGGTGRRAPWHLLAGWDPGLPLILAGGLTPENVAEAIRIVRPFGVDVASGVEASPGKKDPDRLRRFIENARTAALTHGL